ncbi:hypothetical protein Bhyg_14411, partial [Pseudolycoriella hygida]
VNLLLVIACHFCCNVFLSDNVVILNKICSANIPIIEINIAKVHQHFRFLNDVLTLQSKMTKFDTKFIRPHNIPYPNIWLAFEAPDVNGDMAKYRIQDIPKDRFDDAVQHMETHYIADETLCRARNLANDKKSVNDLKSIWKELIRDEKLSLVCFKEGSEEIVGINVLFIEEKNAVVHWDEYESEHVKDMELASFYMMDQFDAFEHYQVERYLSCFGLSVAPAYRQRGIAVKLLEARVSSSRSCINNDNLKRMTAFVRPQNIPYPNIWLTFEAPDVNGDLVKYRIQDIPKDRFVDAVQHMKTHYIADETLCRARNVTFDKKSVNDLKYIWKELIRDEKLSLVCFKEGSDEIVGMNVLFIEEKNAVVDWDEYESEHVKDMELASFYMMDQFDAFEHYQVERYLSAFGLSVAPAYRRLGIAVKLLEARKHLGKACGLTLTSNLFHSSVSQKVAEKAGFEKNFEISFEELAKKDARYTFNVDDPTCAIYSMRI